MSAGNVFKTPHSSFTVDASHPMRASSLLYLNTTNKKDTETYAH